MKRTRMVRRKPKAGAPRVKGRPAISAPAWKALVADLIQRCGSRCESCGFLAALQPHHVKPCSLGGSDDAENILCLCDTCHKRVDWAYSKGKLVCDALGNEKFRIALEFRESKRHPVTNGSIQFYERPSGTF
jgi:hypothetical protein